MFLITTKNITGKDKTIGIVTDYYLRWKIEENFKFKKQQYGLESIKIRKYNRNQALGKLLSIVLFFNNVLNMTAIGKHVRKITKQARKNISFWLYRIADGLSKSIAFFGYDLMIELYPHRQPRRYDLFTVGHIRFNPCLNCSN